MLTELLQVCRSQNRRQIAGNGLFFNGHQLNMDPVLFKLFDLNGVACRLEAQFYKKTG
jgi:hypothetical protein